MKRERYAYFIGFCEIGRSHVIGKQCFPKPTGYHRTVIGSNAAFHGMNSALYIASIGIDVIGSGKANRESLLDASMGELKVLSNVGKERVESLVFKFGHRSR
jgi:hypothetical protein